MTAHTSGRPPYALVGGNPARVLKLRFERPQIEALPAPPGLR